MRSTIATVCGIGVAIGIAPSAALGAVQPLTITYRGTAAIGSAAVDQNAAPFTVAELSGITFRSGNAAAGEYVAVMDGSNKLVRLSVGLHPNGAVNSLSVIAGVTLIATNDNEGVAFTTPGRNSVFVAEEGIPIVSEYSLTNGAILQALNTPGVFANRRANNGFESMARRTSNGELWTANEEALTVDGSISSQAAGTTVRLLRYSPGTTPVAAEQYAYVVDSWHGGSISGARSGLCDIVALPSGTLLSLERSLAASLNGLFRSRIYEVTAAARASATNVAGMPGLTGQTYTPVSKRLLWESFSIGQNLEGLCLGPKLSNGNRSLLGVVDDGDIFSNNTLVAFELAGTITCPADFNEDEAVTVQDIFDFLAAWFAGNASADFNGAGGVSVQDIFDFLAAWFGGC